MLTANQNKELNLVTGLSAGKRSQGGRDGFLVFPLIGLKRGAIFSGPIKWRYEANPMQCRIISDNRLKPAHVENTA